MYKRPHFFLQPKHKFSFHQMIDDAIIRDHPQFVYPISSVSKVVLTNLSTHHHVQLAACTLFLTKQPGNCIGLQEIHKKASPIITVPSRGETERSLASLQKQKKTS